MILLLNMKTLLFIKRFFSTKSSHRNESPPTNDPNTNYQEIPRLVCFEKQFEGLHDNDREEIDNNIQTGLYNQNLFTTNSVYIPSNRAADKRIIIANQFSHSLRRAISIVREKRRNNNRKNDLLSSINCLSEQVSNYQKYSNTARREHYSVFTTESLLSKEDIKVFRDLKKEIRASIDSIDDTDLKLWNSLYRLKGRLKRLLDLNKEYHSSVKRVFLIIDFRKLIRILFGRPSTCFENGLLFK